MTTTFVVLGFIGVIAAAALGVLVDRVLTVLVLDRWFKNPRIPHLIGLTVAIVVLAIFVAWSSLLLTQDQQGKVSSNEEMPLTEGPIPTSTLTPTPTPTLADDPEPIANVGKAIFFDPLTEEKLFPAGQDADGKSWYGDGGYNVQSVDTKNGWIWVIPDKTFQDLIMEVDAMPVTKGSVTGYSLVLGWNQGGNYHSFQVRPDGKCGLLKFNANYTTQIPILNCPKPVEEKNVTVRLEIPERDREKNRTCMRIFIEGEYIGEQCTADYDGGLIGLGVYNGGIIGSGVEAQARFNNLTVWRPPVEPSQYYK